MQVTTSVWFCLAYILGLALAGFAGLPLWLLIILAAISGGLEFVFRRWWRARFPIWFWLVMGAVTVVAMFYFQLRLPQTSSTDVSRFVDVLRSREVIVQGEVQSLPRTTRSGKTQVWLKTNGIDVGMLASRLTTPPETATGRLYVTLPEELGQQFHPGLAVRLKGNLYQPNVAKNPGGFNFQKFLQRQNCFAGMRVDTVEEITPAKGWGLWRVQQRIIQSLSAKLPASEGALVSAIVLGGRVVNLPFELKDQFAQVGLAHVLAASGFHVALVLNTMLFLTQRLSKRWQFGSGVIALLLFLSLTGLQPSVCRAAVMGGAVLLGVLVDRKANAIGSLLFATTFLLLLNPLWVSDLGFQFSVLATLGLVVTVPWLMESLTWLPTGIASALAVPIAAFIWTVPLQLHTFGVMSPYAILVNLFTAPLVVLISLGGMVNALLAMGFPAVASWTVLIVHYPIVLLLGIVGFVSRLPGSVAIVGALPIFLVVLLYSLLSALWWREDWRRYAWAIGLAGAAIVWLPSLHWQNTVTQVTALATNDQPVMVFQDRGKAGLVNSGKEKTASMTVVPFLQRQGVRRLDWAIALSRQSAEFSGWERLRERVSIRHSHHVASLAGLSHSRGLEVDRSVKLGRSRASQVYASPDVLSVNVGAQRWLLFAGLPGRVQPDLARSSGVQNHQVMWWPGGRLRESLVENIQPQVAIAYGRRLDNLTEEMLERRGVQVFWLKRDGAVQWRRGKGFRSTLDGVDASSVLL